MSQAGGRQGRLPTSNEYYEGYSKYGQQGRGGGGGGEPGGGGNYSNSPRQDNAGRPNSPGYRDDRAGNYGQQNDPGRQNAQGYGGGRGRNRGQQNDPGRPNSPEYGGGRGGNYGHQDNRRSPRSPDYSGGTYSVSSDSRSSGGYRERERERDHRDRNQPKRQGISRTRSPPAKKDPNKRNDISRGRKRDSEQILSAAVEGNSASSSSHSKSSSASGSMSKENEKPKDSQKSKTTDTSSSSSSSGSSPSSSGSLESETESSSKPKDSKPENAMSKGSKVSGSSKDGGDSKLSGSNSKSLDEKTSKNSKLSEEGTMNSKTSGQNSKDLGSKASRDSKNSKFSEGTKNSKTFDESKSSASKTFDESNEKGSKSGKSSNVSGGGKVPESSGDERSRRSGNDERSRRMDDSRDSRKSDDASRSHEHRKGKKNWFTNSVSKEPDDKDREKKQKLRYAKQGGMESQNDDEHDKLVELSNKPNPFFRKARHRPYRHPPRRGMAVKASVVEIVNVYFEKDYEKEGSRSSHQKEVSSSQEGEDDDRYHKDRRKDSKKYKNVDHNGEFSHTGYTKDSSHTGDSAGKSKKSDRTSYFERHTTTYRRYHSDGTPVSTLKGYPNQESDQNSDFGYSKRRHRRSGEEESLEGEGEDIKVSVDGNEKDIDHDDDDDDTVDEMDNDHTDDGGYSTTDQRNEAPRRTTNRGPRSDERIRSTDENNRPQRNSRSASAANRRAMRSRISQRYNDRDSMDDRRSRRFRESTRDDEPMYYENPYYESEYYQEPMRNQSQYYQEPRQNQQNFGAMCLCKKPPPMEETKNSSGDSSRAIENIRSGRASKDDIETLKQHVRNNDKTNKAILELLKDTDVGGTYKDPCPCSDSTASSTPSVCGVRRVPSARRVFDDERGTSWYQFHYKTESISCCDQPNFSANQRSASQEQSRPVTPTSDVSCQCDQSRNSGNECRNQQCCPKRPVLCQCPVYSGCVAYQSRPICNKPQLAYKTCCNCPVSRGLGLTINKICACGKTSVPAAPQKQESEEKTNDKSMERNNKPVCLCGGYRISSSAHQTDQGDRGECQCVSTGLRGDNKAVCFCGSQKTSSQAQNNNSFSKDNSICMCTGNRSFAQSNQSQRGMCLCNGN